VFETWVGKQKAQGSHFETPTLTTSRPLDCLELPAGTQPAYEVVKCTVENPAFPLFPDCFDPAWDRDWCGNRALRKLAEQVWHREMRVGRSQ
jgi:hypothetical protein